jgi:hypothetical protein
MKPKSDPSPIAAFSSLPWHDSKFRRWEVVYDSDDESAVKFEIVFRGPEGPTGCANVTFHDSRGVYADMDLLAKRLCNDQIASAYCEHAESSQEPFVQRLNDRFDLYRGESTAQLFLFRVNLIHPAGEILVLARSFSLSQGAPGNRTR